MTSSFPKRRIDGPDSSAAGSRVAPNTAQRCHRRRSVPVLLGGIASVARSEQRRFEFFNIASTFGESAPGHDALPCPPLLRSLPSQETEMHSCTRDSPTVEEIIAESSDSSTESEAEVEVPPVEVPPRVLPPLKQLLPQEWQHDRGLLQAWQKARDMAARPGIVSFCGSFELTGAVYVTSKSEGTKRAVNLATCRCNCPNPRFCTHLLAAALVADSERLRGRVALLCHLREHLRRHGRGGNDVAVAEKVAHQVVQELSGPATQAQVVEWAVDASVRLACAMQGMGLEAAVDAAAAAAGFIAEQGVASTMTRSQSGRSRSPWGRCHIHGASVSDASRCDAAPVPSLHPRTRQALTFLAAQAATSCKGTNICTEAVVDSMLQKLRFSSIQQPASGLANAAVEVVVIMLRCLDASRDMLPDPSA